ncbi:hypothetical protein R8N68_02315 [Vibrio sp. 1974]|uniref:hypothetical protein n=1 Tax=Vibrio TaxID=662 RepID=UPI002964D509|nr:MULTISPECIES: hypothetical protein [unclassified Vibrio]MDW2123466.1 hypothetical protein [Vibrio sp. 2033]MDW3119882.1 hypothetical protein [Vibrio sp. 1974]
MNEILEYQSYYIFLNAFTLVYFLFRKSEIRLYSVFVLSFFLYHSPFLFGESIWKVSGISYEISFSEASYLILCFNSTFLLLMLLLSDLYYKSERSVSYSYDLSKANVQFFWIMLFFTLMLILTYYISSDFEALKVSTKVVPKSHAFKLAVPALIMATIMSFWYRNKLYIFLLLLCHFSIFIVGNRLPIVISIIAISYLYLSGTRVRFISKWKFLLVSLFFLMVIIHFKILYHAFVHQKYDMLIAVLNGEFLMYSIQNAEPTHVSAVYNEVVTNEFKISIGYLFQLIFVLIPFIPSLFGFKPTSFASLYKGYLFGNEGDSFASNFWAVGYSLFEVYGIFISLFMVVALVLYIDMLQKRFISTSSLKKLTLVLSFSCTLVFYIHRNDYTFIISLLRSFFIVWFMAYLVHYIVLKLGSKTN